MAKTKGKKSDAHKKKGKGGKKSDARHSKKKGGGKKGKGAPKRFKGKATLAPQIHGGLNEDRMKSGGGKFAERVEVKTGGIARVQFLTDPSDPNGFVEIDQHQFKASGRWNYIACGGKGCPMCKDDDPEVAAIKYRFFAVVWDFSKKKVAILEGPKTLSQKIFKRWKENKKKFTSTVYEVSKEAGPPVQWDIGMINKKPTSTKNLDLIDIRANIVEQFKWALGPDVKVDIKALEAELGVETDEDTADALEDVVITKKMIKKMVDKGKEDELMKIALNFGIKKKKLKAMELDEMGKAILKAQG